MGFGLLFVGYFFLIFFPLSRIDVLPNIALIGCVVMLFGINRLFRYCRDNRAFGIAKALAPVLVAVSIGAFMLDIAGIDGMLDDGINAWLMPITNAVYALTIVSFTAALFVGVHRLAREVGLPRLAKRSVFTLSLNAAYLIAELAASVFSLLRTFVGISGESFTIVTGYTGIIAFLFAYVILFFNMALIFSCYARICLEGDEDMPYSEDIFDKIVAWTKRNKNK